MLNAAMLFHVSGVLLQATANDPYIIARVGNTSYAGFGVANSNGIDPVFFVNGAGNVGIGTGSPGARLEIFGPAIVSGVGRRLARFYYDSPLSSGVGAGLDLGGRFSTTNPNPFTTFANIKGVKANATNNDSAGLLVLSAANASGTFVEVARFGAGSATFSGTVTGTNIQAHYQDLAEWVPAEGTRQPAQW